MARPRRGPAAYRARARERLQRIRQASLLVIALTALLLLAWREPAAPVGQEPMTPPAAVDTAVDAGESVEEAAGTVRDLLIGAYALLPRLGIALTLILIAAILARVARPVLLRILRNWEKAEAMGALAQILIWLVALGAALSVIAGDARALVGSVGLFGLALSWSLQTPIESFTGWLLNSFRSYYRVGDRIAVGDVFGDVYRIDILTTTVWEAGGPEKPVQGAQATGALITFPNSEVLRANIVNFTRDFPFVWDEITINVANESDLAYSSRVVQQTAERVVGPAMAGPAAEYRELVELAGLDEEIALEPRVYAAAADSWTSLTVRYLVPARQRRYWASELLIAISTEIVRPEHHDRLIPGYPCTRVELLDEPTDRASETTGPATE